MCTVFGAIATGAIPAGADGSANLYPQTVAPACKQQSLGGACRANIEWRTTAYGPTGKTTIPRRDLFYVYLTAGQYLEMGSSAVGVTSTATGPTTTGDVVVYNPGQITAYNQPSPLPAFTGTPVNGVYTNGFSCLAQRAANPGSPNLGKLTTRTQELAGAQAVSGGGNPTGYQPCYYVAPATGIYNVAFYGPDGGNYDADGTVGADIGLTNANDTSAAQGTSIAAWDLSVRASSTSTTNINGEVFTFAYDAFTGGNGLPVNSDIYITTLDGYEYKTSLNYLDPNGFMVYGNAQGFLAADGSILDHDVLGTTNSGQLTALAGGTNFAKAQYPISFSGPLNAATLTALGIPTTPVVYSINSIGFSGTATGNTSTIGTGGTFTFDASSKGVYQLVISSNTTTPNYDPTLSTNRVLRGIATAGVNTVTWDGNDNVGTPFPVGTAYRVQATFQNGEYHFPLLDAENSVLGGPSFTLINPPDGICPFGNTKCTTGFYDDRGYFSPGAGGGNVGTPGVELCGNNPPATAYSNPITGFDSSSTQRAWGTQTGGNANLPCQLNPSTAWGSFGDVKGLDFWTYFPQPVPQVTALNIVATPPTLTVVKTSTTSVITSVGQVVPYSFLVTNNGTQTLNSITVTDTQVAPSLNGSLSAISCPSTTLLAGANETCTANYTVTAADVAHGSVIDSATVTGTPTAGPSVTSTPSVLSLPVASITIQKTANPTSVSAAGQVVTYSFKVTNTGTSDLSGVAVNDTQIAPSLNGSLSAISCPSTTLQTGLSETCTATYTVTQADIDNGTINDSATASGTPSQGGPPITSSPSAATVAASQNPSIGLVKSASPTSYAAPGTLITYHYLVTNSGNVTLSSVGVGDPMPGLSAINCPRRPSPREGQKPALRRTRPPRRT